MSLRLTKTTTDRETVAMSNNYQENWQDDEDFDFEETSRQPNESDLLKQLRKELKNKTRALTELETQLGSVRASQREATIKSVLETKGVNQKIAKFIPSDIDTSPEVISNWVDENADVFGLAVNRQEEPKVDLSTLRSIDNVTANAQTPTNADDMSLRIQNASEDELIAMIHAAGGGYGS